MKKRVLLIVVAIASLSFLLFFVLQKGKKPSGILQVSANSFQNRRIIKDTLRPILQAKFPRIVRVVAADGRIVVSTPDSLILYEHNGLKLRQTYRWYGYKDAGWLDSSRITFVSENLLPIMSFQALIQLIISYKQKARMLFTYMRLKLFTPLKLKLMAVFQNFGLRIGETVTLGKIIITKSAIS